MENADESILDAPREGLDPEVWTMSEDGQYRLSERAKAAVDAVVQYGKRRLGTGVSARIVGSITSNQYSDGSDIDVHLTFDGLSEEDAEVLNAELRKGFDAAKKDGEVPSGIGGHPIEIYLQPNLFQDMMSVGCYDVQEERWVVGPDMKPTDFDPYEEFYSEDMEHVKDVLEDVRRILLGCNETATVVLNSADGEFREGEFEALKALVREGADVFEAAKRCRKAFSSPTSEEDALRKRESRKWKVADSAFKLMDKFGYLKALKGITNIRDRMEFGDEETVSEAVLRCIGGSIGMKDEETVDESVAGAARTMAIAALLAIPGLLPKETLAARLDKVPKQEMRIGSQSVQKAISDSAKSTRTIGGYSETNVVNMLTRTLYREAMDQDRAGRLAVASVIWNRADGDPENFPAVLKEKEAFSCWNDMTKSDWKNFKYTIPTDGLTSVFYSRKNTQIWNECLEIAKRLAAKDFESTIGDRNSYLNPKTASEKAKKTWGKKMDLQMKDHKFGYLREHDPKYVIPGTMTQRAKSAANVNVQAAKKNVQGKVKAVAPTKVYVVRKGDTLTRIAKANGKTVDEVKKLNPGLKNPNMLKIGQKLNV